MRAEERTTPGVLPETDAILALLRQLDLRPRALPEMHEILALLRQLYAPPGASPQALLRPVSVPVPGQPVPRMPARTGPELVALDITVRAFFTRVPWDGPAANTVAESPGPRRRASLSQVMTRPIFPSPGGLRTGTLSVSVRDFLGAIPWDGTTARPASSPSRQSLRAQAGRHGAPHAVAVQPRRDTQLRELPVRAFFAGVAWDGQAVER